MLADHPELLEAAVYGVPSELGGQEVMVAVVRRPESEITAEELLDFCTGKMPHFAVPRYVRFMDAAAALARAARAEAASSRRRASRLRAYGTARRSATWSSVS